MYRTDDEIDDMGIPGIATAVAALALALEENGVLHKDAYCGALRRLWDAMPDGEAIGESGAVIEKVLGILDDAGSGSPEGSEGRKPRLVA
jgi:hypothetical protein